MGNGFSAALLCCTRPPRAAAPHHSIVEPWPSDDEALGHSFRYLHSSPRRRFPAAASPPSSPPDHHPPPILSFRAISGAAVSANSSSRPVLRPRPRPRDQGSSSPCAASPVPSNPSGFEGSSSFAAAPLQLSSAAAASASSGPLDRGSFFLSGPIERGAVSGPLDGDGGGAPFSGPLASKNRKNRRRRRAFPGSDSAVLLAAPFFRRSVSERRSRRPWVVPLRGQPRPRVQWAQGKAGEDLVHVVVSEEHRWLFVGIYDGFNGADAPEFLVAHLYHAVFDQLRGLFWEEQEEQAAQEAAVTGAIALKDEGEEFGGNREAPFAEEPRIRRPLWEFLADSEDGGSRTALCSVSDRFVFPSSKPRDGIGSWQKGCRKIQFSQWRYGGEGKEKATEEGTYRGRRRRWKTGTIADQGLVLQALSRALEITECAYLEMTDREISRNPELALTGSCVLVVLMRGDDVYVMNVGDSRAIIGQCRSPVQAAGVVEATENCGDGLVLEEVEAPSRGVEEAGDQEVTQAMELVALQLSTDHSTSIEEEVRRIKEEHPDDSKCIVNNRVKGRLKVTRAFGAGFLKQPKWNNGLLEVFRNEYVGVAPYISCFPSLCHHKLARNDQFLVVSSDGLYQYFTNEEVVSHVKNFMERFPDGDPAQSLIEELLYRAASRAGMDFFELLDIPQGDRRKYHDDVTVIVVSLEGRTWRSSGKY